MILSFTLKYCGYHRLLFYITLIGYICYLTYIWIAITSFWSILGFISLIIAIIIICIIVYYYITNGRIVKTYKRK